MDAEPIKIPDEFRPFVLQKCRHEFGHYVIAKVLGFGTGNVSFRLNSLQGHHIASSQIFVQRPTTDVPSILTYLEQRIQVLYSGAIAETASEHGVDLRAAQHELRQGGAQTDLTKIEELVAMHLNISQPDAMEDAAREAARGELMGRLFRASAMLVRVEYGLISELATSLASRVTVIKGGIGMHASEIDAIEPMKTRFASEVTAP